MIEQAKQYAKNVVCGKEITTPEVIIQCKWFLDDLENQKLAPFNYYLDTAEIQKVEGILKLLNFATGIDVVGKNVLNNLADFQAFFFVNVFGWRFKTDNRVFRYKDIDLFIPRKNAKTWIVAVTFIVLLLTEDDYSEFYSICLNRDLAGRIKQEMTQMIQASPDICEHFKISPSLSGKIVCKITNSFYQARISEANKNNSIKPSAFIADEIGAFTDNKNIMAMQSGQLSVRNPLRFKITSAYAESQSIMISELDYLSEIYGGIKKNDRVFALLYYATEEHQWDDYGILMSNPLRIEKNYQEIRDNRDKALSKPDERTEYLTKNMNVFLKNSSEQRYMNIDLWKKCQVDKVSFKGKHVVVGVDLSTTTDLTAVSIMCRDENNYYLKAKGFLPFASLITRREDIDYEQYEKLGYCEIHRERIVVTETGKKMSVGGHTIDYEKVEAYIRSIPAMYECTIDYIVSDPYNALEMMQRLAADYEVVFIKQTYTNLSPSNKGFRDNVYNGTLFYEKNLLLDFCASSAVECRAKITEDILLAKENKNKSRIDLLMSSIFAFSQLHIQKFDINKYLSDEYLDKLYGGK
jgi:phage terminase large subunit-like protein